MATLKEKRQQILGCIPDENVRNIIFNFDNLSPDFLSDENTYISYFSNLMTFTATVILNSFLEWKRNYSIQCENGKLSNSMMRIYNMLDRAYDPNKFNGNFVDDLIFNLCMDYFMDTSSEECFSETVGIQDFFRFPSVDNKLSRYIYQLKQKRIDSKYDTDFGFEQLRDCFEMFRFLRYVKAEYYDKGIKQNGAPSGLMGVKLNISNCLNCKFASIDLMYSLCVTRMGAYYMEDFVFSDAKKFDSSHNKKQSLKLNYVMFDGRDTFSVTLLDGTGKRLSGAEFEWQYPTAIEDFFIDYDVINVSCPNANVGFFRDGILLNNRYLKEFSLILADTLSTQTKTKILSRYQPKYSNMLDKMYVTSLYSKTEWMGYRWDEIVLFLMLEEGVYDFLKFLLKYEKYNQFVKMFERRFVTVKEICKNDPFIANPEINLKDSPSESNLIECYARALMLLASKILTINEWSVEENIYPSTIDDILAEAESIYDSKKYDESNTTKYLVSLVVRTSLFVDSFYSGVFDFARMRKGELIKLEMSNTNFVDYKSYRDAKDRWLVQMREKISETIRSRAASRFKWHDAQSQDVQTKSINRINRVFALLQETNKRCESRKDSLGEIVFDTLGRRKLFDDSDMELLHAALIEALSSETKRNDKLFNAVTVYLKYLKTGSLTDDGEGVLENAIYPIIGQYYSGVTSRDGYRYSYFKVGVAKDSKVNKDYEEETTNIKVITDDEFDFGCSYYCIPNIHRVANLDESELVRRIWVDPIILPCSVYMPPSIMRIEKLEDKSDYAKAIELIYASDPNLYSGLFGTVDNAKKVMTFMFDNPSSKFYKKRYSLLKKEGKPIAIAALFNSKDFKLDVDIELKAFRDSGVEPPETFGQAMLSLSQVFNDFIGTSYCLIDDVCVAEKHRRRGNGKSLILYLVKKAASEGKQVILSVDCDNVAAFNFYSSLGFVEYSNESSVDKLGKKYAKMFRIL